MRENLLSKGVLYWGYNSVLPVPWRNVLFLDYKNISHIILYIPLLLLLLLLFQSFTIFYRILEAILSTVSRLKWRIYMYSIQWRAAWLCCFENSTNTFFFYCFSYLFYFFYLFIYLSICLSIYSFIFLFFIFYFLIF